MEDSRGDWKANNKIGTVVKLRDTQTGFFKGQGKDSRMGWEWTKGTTPSVLFAWSCDCQQHPHRVTTRLRSVQHIAGERRDGGQRLCTIGRDVAAQGQGQCGRDGIWSGI